MNDLQIKETRQRYFDSVKSLLVDSFKYILPNFRVRVRKVDVVDFGNTKAFIAEFYDNDGTTLTSVTGNEYWMEFDYPKDSISALQNNPAYKLLKDMPSQADTALSFFYLGDIKYDPVVSDQLKIQVVPFPKNFNFDSSRQANTKRK